MKSLAAYAMRGRLYALWVIFGFAVGSMVLPPVSLLSTALLALVALRKGAAESAWVLLLALLCLGIGGILLVGSAFQAIVYGLLLWLPVWPVAILLRNTRRLDWALVLASLLGLAAVMAVYLLADNPAAFWREKMQPLLQAMQENSPPGVDATALEQAVDIFSHYLTGTMVAASVVSVILALLIARWQQAVLFNPGGFRSEFVALRMRAEVVYVTLACLLTGILAAGLAAEIAWNLTAVFMVLFIFCGFAVLHALLGGKTFWIVGVYFVLFISPQLLLPPIALLGLSDTWLDWRKLDNRV